MSDQLVFTFYIASILMAHLTKILQTQVQFHHSLSSALYWPKYCVQLCSKFDRSKLDNNNNNNLLADDWVII